jgi:O-6-methylguanine DNA methyltransferase
VIYRFTFKTPLGEMGSVATERGIVLLILPPCKPEYIKQWLSRHYPASFAEFGGDDNRRLASQINEYLRGDRKRFELPVDLQVTPFQSKVLKEVAQIPYGQTRSYGAIAARIGNPDAARAVGAANARNPLPLIIPCHRVVAGNGLGGYRGGAAMKLKLLKLEQDNF